MPGTYLRSNLTASTHTRRPRAAKSWRTQRRLAQCRTLPRISRPVSCIVYGPMQYISCILQGRGGGHEFRASSDASSYDGPASGRETWRGFAPERGAGASLDPNHEPCAHQKTYMNPEFLIPTPKILDAKGRAATTRGTSWNQQAGRNSIWPSLRRQEPAVPSDFATPNFHRGAGVGSTS